MDKKLLEKFKEIINEKYKYNLSDSELAEVMSGIEALAKVVAIFNERISKQRHGRNF